jgi:hypothetical protein
MTIQPKQKLPTPVATLRPERGNSAPKHDANPAQLTKPLRAQFGRKYDENSVGNTQSQQHPADLRFCDRVRALLSEACGIGRLRDTGQLSFTGAQAKIPTLYDSLHRICKTPCQHPEAENLGQRLLNPKRDYHRLFTFLNVNRMPPTNNYAEQTLRHPVIFRKLIFGNRSEQGAHTMAVNLSLIHTAKCLRRDLIPLLKTTLLSGSQAAANFLFSNSS